MSLKSLLHERSEAQEDTTAQLPLASETGGLVGLAGATGVARSQGGQSGGR